MELTAPTALSRRTVGDLVAEDYGRAAVLHRYGIDFCCGGNKTLDAACEAKGLDPTEVAQALLDERRATGPTDHADPRDWAPGFLADYVVNVHHRYVRQSIPPLQDFTRKVARVHGRSHPETIQIATLFDVLAADLEEHMAEEEHAVFPAIKALAAEDGSADAVRTPIEGLEHDHDHAGELMRQIRSLSDDYTPPPDACSTFRAAYAKLADFEADLHRHVHLENNVLFPKALALGRKAATPNA